MTRNFILASTALAGLWTMPAFGQASSASVATGTQTAPIPEGVPTPGTSAQADDSAGIADIVVTAQRRAENLQRSSLSIEVLSGGQLDAVTKPQDLTNVSPGVVIANNGPQVQVYVRGVGDATGNSQGQSAVAFNIDGIYVGRQTAVGPGLFDLERIEILKGPQGTLYGRNASAGAVNVLTNRPKLNTLNGYGAAEVGNLDLVRAEAGFNVPLGTTVALRVAGQVTSRDGYLSDGTNDEHTQAIRARLLFQPSERLSLLLNADYSHSGGRGGGVVITPAPTKDPFKSSTTAPFITPFLFSPATAPLTTPDDAYLNIRNYGVSADVTADLGFAKLTVIPAYRRQNLTAVYYTANFRYAEHPITEQASGEARLSNESDKLKWVAGIYLFQEKQDNFYSNTTGALAAGNVFQDRKAYAGFGQATYSVTESLRLIGGLRYTHETVDGRYNSGTGAIRAVPYVQTTPLVRTEPVKANNFSFKVGAEFDLAAGTMLYASYATGFKAGGFNSTRLCATDPYGGEKLKAFTVGARNRFLDNRLQVNVEGFRWKYDDLQGTLIAPNACGEIFQLKRNIGDATIKGASLDVVFRASSSDTLHGSVEFVDSNFDRFSLNQLGPAPYLGFGSPCGATPIGGGLFNINCVGQQLPRTPRWSGTVGYEHVFQLSKGDITFAGNGQFASQRLLDYGYVANSRAAGYAQLNAALTYNAPGRRWSFGGYINNITNEVIYTGGTSVTFPTTVVAPNGSPYYATSVQPPRTYGARLRFKFGE